MFSTVIFNWDYYNYLSTYCYVLRSNMQKCNFCQLKSREGITDVSNTRYTFLKNNLFKALSHLIYL